MPSKSRKGWKRLMSSPWSRTIRPTSAGLPSNARKSFSKISTASKPAVEMAASLSGSSPLIETVAIRVFINPSDERTSSYITDRVWSGCGQDKDCGLSRRQSVRADDMAKHHVDRVALQRCLRLCCRKVASEQSRKGGTIGNIEEAEGADKPVQFHGIEAAAEQTFLHAALIDGADRRDGSDVELADDLRFFQILGMVNILDHHHADEILMLVVVIEGEFHK